MGEFLTSFQKTVVIPVISRGELSAVERSGPVTPDRSLALALLVGVLGVFVGRALPRDDAQAYVTVPAAPMPPITRPTDHDCKTESIELSSTKVRLALCMAYRASAPEAAPSRAPEASEPEPLKTRRERGRATFTHAVNEDRKLLDSYPEAVIVRHSDGKIGVYKPDEWPSDGDGQIVARKFSDGHIGWYAGPDAGPRSDPAAFQPLAPSGVVPSVMAYQPDGTITQDGVEADPAVQQMFGGKVRDAGR
jgi:hypothetical protein